MELTVQILKLDGGHMVCVALASGRNMEKSGGHAVWSFYLTPRDVLYKPNTPPTKKYSAQCARAESLTIVPPQHLAQQWLISYKKHPNFLSAQEVRIWHEIVQGEIDRFVVFTPKKWHFLVSLMSSALLSVDPGHEAYKYSSVVSVTYSYSAVNAFGTSNPEEPSICIAFNKSCYSWAQAALLTQLEVQ